jgi:hypothetical protein
MSANAMDRPKIEVTERATRRRFAAEYKRRVLAEAAVCTKPGEVGALLRREGLYSSHLALWRAARDRGAMAELAPKRRGPKPRVEDDRDVRLRELERECARLRARAERAEALIELQKKVAEILGRELPTSGEGRS